MFEKVDIASPAFKQNPYPTFRKMRDQQPILEVKAGHRREIGNVGQEHAHSLGRRSILWIGVTTNPTALWLANQITEAFPWDTAPKYLIRDNDGAYGEVFTRRLRAIGIRDRATAPQSPWQNGYVERVIGSIRRECLDHLIVRNQAHLRRILDRCIAYYNSPRFGKRFT